LATFNEQIEAAVLKIPAKDISAKSNIKD